MTFAGWDLYKKTPEPLAPYVRDEEVRRAFQSLDLEPTVVAEDVEVEVGPPGVPTNLRMINVEYHPNQVSEIWYSNETTILWDAPTGDNSEDILGYEVEVKGLSEGDPNVDDISRYAVLLAGSPYDVGLHLMASFSDTGTIGLVPQSFASTKTYSYMFRVRASNKHGIGGWSGVLSLDGLLWQSVDAGGGDPDATATEPGKVTNVQASKGVGQIDVIWSAPASGGAITGYEVNYHFRISSSGDTSDDTSVSPEHSGKVTSYEHNNLMSGEYQYKVRATGPGGEGPYSTYSSWTAIVFVPGKVTGGTASVDDGRTVVSWDEPTGGPVTDYDVELRIFLSGKYSAWVDVIHVGTARMLTDSSVTNGQKYQFHVRGGNSAGEGPYSDAFPADGVIPVAVVPVPNKVQLGTVSSGDMTATILWAAPSGGTVTDYDVQYRSDSSGGTSYGNWTDHDHVGTALTATVSSLTNGSRYQFQIRGGNATGEGEWSDPMPTGGVVPQIPVPGKVLLGTVKSGDAEATISWAAPLGTVTDYDVQYRFVEGSSPGNYGDWFNHAHEGTSLTATVTGLTNLYRYQFRVRGGNAGGEGPWSNPLPASGIIPKIPVPGKVLRVAVVSSGDMIASLSWNDPTGTVTDYDVQYRFVVGASPGNYGDWFNHTHVGVSSVATVSSLTNGNRYQFRVRGGNDTGEGEWSDPFPSSGVIPLAPVAPGRVTNVQLVAAVDSMAVTWSEPASGGPITGYDVVYQYRVDTSARPDDTDVSPAHDGTGTSYAHTNLVYGEYKYKVRAKGPGGNGRYSVLSDWKSLVSVVPGKVTSVSVSASDASITVTWDAPTTGSPPTGYYVHYRYDDQEGTNYSNWINTPHTGTDRTLTQTVANGRRYQYRVRAYNTAGSGPWSDSTPSSGIVTVAALPVPGKVGRGTVSVGDTTATVYWSAPSGGGTASDYDVQYRSDASGGTSYGNWADHSHVGTALNATVTGLTNGSNYQFQVRGGNATGEGEWSDPMPPDGVVPKIPVPGKVSLVSTTAGNTTVDISWPAPTGIVTDYDVQHRFLIQAGFSIWTDKSHTGTARTSTVSRLTNGVKYQFRVRGGNSTGEGPWSDAFPSGGVIPKLPVPGKVSGGRATPGDTIVDISWDAPTGTVTDYDIQYQLNFNNAWSIWIDIQFAGTARTYHFAGTINGVRQRFRVRGGNATGEGAWSNAFPSGGVTPRINVPGKVGRVTVAAGDATISLSWANPTGDVTDFDVQYRFDAVGGASYGNWTDASHNGNSRSFTTAATNLYRYQFRVRGGNGTGEGDWSDAYPSGGAVPKILVPGKVPTGTASRSGDRTSITVSWSAPPGPVTDYDIQYRWDTNGGTSYGEWRNFVIGNIRTLTLSSLETGYSYQFRIRAGNSSGKGAWSDAFPVVVVPGKVSGGTVTASDSRVIVSWDAPTTGSDVTSYDVQYRSDAMGRTSYGNWVDISHAGTSSMFERAAINGSRYQFRVRGVNAGGAGTYSDAFPSAGAVPVASLPGQVAKPTLTTSPGQVIVDWSAPAGGPITGYDVQYHYDPATVGSMRLPVTPIDVSPHHSGTSTSYIHSFLPGGIYQYRVQATGPATFGAYSVWSSITVVTGVSTVPGKVPSGTTVPSSGSISIEWAAPTTGSPVTGYDLQYRFDNSGGTNYGNWLDISHSGTSRTKTRAFFNGYRHQFRVRGSNSAGNGSYSDAFPSAGVIPRAPLAPGKVTDVRVSTGNGIISVSWDAPSGTVTDYDLFYRVDSSGGTSYGGWIDLSHSGTNRSWSIRNSSINDRRYQFRVRANNGAQLGAWSDATPSGGAVPGVVRTIPGKVSGGAVAASDGSMTITWDAPTSGSPVDRYVIAYRVDTGGGTSYGGWTGITTTNTSRTFTRTVFNARRYQYRVHAVNSAGNGAWSDAFPSGGVVAVAAAPPVPTNGSAVAGDGTVAISWTFTGQVSSFTVQSRRITFGMAGLAALTGFFSTDITSDTSARTAVHANAINGRRYQYRVRATFQGTNGSYTQPFPSSGVVPVAPVVVVPVVVPGAPGKPSGVTGNGSITLSWDPPTTGGDVSSYRLEYQLTSPGSPWVLVSSTIGAGTTRYLHSGRTNGIAYRYRILGYNDGGSGAWSPTSDSLTPTGVPGKPGDLTVSSIPATIGRVRHRVTLVDANRPTNNGSIITSYFFEKERQDVNSRWVADSDYTDISLTVIRFNSFSAASLSYRFRVRAVNENGHGPWSDWAS